MNVFVRRKFDAAHRLLNDEGKCHNLHGHTWKVEVEITGPVDLATDMVIDFREVKRIIDIFDHSVTLNSADPLVPLLSGYTPVVRMPRGWEPTAERIADYINSHFDPDLEVLVRVWESEDCYAEA
jgi:6-pyruvoyltetrahydropterin/6-carboxytetrahydropterin synthase